MKKKIKKILSIFVFSLVLFSCLASTCFAWEPPPNYQGINGTGYNIAQMGYALDSYGSVAWVFLEFRVPNGSGGYTFEYKYFVDSNCLSIWLDDNNITKIEDIDISSYKSSLTSYGNSWSTSLLDNEILNCLSLLNNGYLIGEDYGYEIGFENGKDLSYNKGYTDGLAESDIAENTILTIFSAPTYILSTIFDFEIFGLNIYTLICFFLTLTIVSFILKRVL